MNIPGNDDFIEKLNTIPPEVTKMLHEIRDIDIQVLQLHTTIQPLRESALEKAEQYANKKNAKIKMEIEDLVFDINQKNEKLMRLSQEKVLLARKLYNCIDQPTEELDRDLVAQSKPQNNSNLPQVKGKSKRGRKQNDWEYDISQPCYCYCGRPSFGSMVMCQNPYCQTEWFHIECIEQKSLGDKWYCNDCRRSRIKARISKEDIRKIQIRK